MSLPAHGQHHPCTELSFRWSGLACPERRPAVQLGRGRLLQRPPHHSSTSHGGLGFQRRGTHSQMLQIYFPKHHENTKITAVGKTEAGGRSLTRRPEGRWPHWPRSLVWPDVHTRTNDRPAPVKGPPPASPAMNCSYWRTGMFLLRLKVKEVGPGN